MATGYQSTYTGEQVDAAVARVQGLDTELATKVDKTTTINGESLSGNITLNAAEVGAMPDTTKYARTITCSNGVIELKDQDGNSFSPAATATITGVTVPWGSITGSISDNTALQTALDALQTNIDGKQATITGAATTIASSNLTNNRALISNGSGKVAVSSVTNTELGYLSGTTSSVQEQLNSKITEEDLTDVIGDYAQADLSNLTNLGDGVNRAVKGYNEDGNLIYDRQLVNDVTNYAHSTFDLSKFTVVGSPVITDDGVASGFSSGNYVRANGITLGSLQNKSFEIKIKFKVGEKSQAIWNPNIDWGYTRFAVEYHVETSYKEFRFYFQFGSSDSSDTSIYQNARDGVNGSNINVGDIYELKYKFDYPNNLTFSICKEGTNNIISAKVSPAEGFTNVGLYAINHYPNGLLQLYKSVNNTEPQDLKQFSITADGVEVFSGNKTGIDTIKPDDYTVVGTPTISADGVASGLDSSNYVQCTSINTDGVIYLPVPNVASDFGGNYVVGTYKLYKNVNWTNRFQLLIDTSSTLIFDSHSNFYNQETDKLILKIVKKGYNYTVYYKINNNDWILQGTYTLEVNPTETTIKFQGGYNLDLNLYKNVVNGSVINQPCLKIPYTESKTGSKIVDMQYLPRVKDAYEQGYSNRYYALQEDYTLNCSVVGTPTIVGTQASGFSASNYLTKVFSSLSGKALKIQNRFLYNSTIDGCISHGVGTNNSPRLTASATNQNLEFYFRGTSDVTFTVPYSNFTANTWYNTEAIITPTKQIFQVTDDNGNVVFKETKSTAQTFDIQAQMATYTVGYRSSTNYFSGTVDLAGFKVFVDGNFVGSPVVAPCVALPMGDIYGEIENLKDLKSDLDRIGQTKALATGNVANYEEEFKEIQERAHSTFDLSKFTVVGSPTITDDGVASGFANGSYIKGQNIDTSTNNFEIFCKFKTGNSVSSPQYQYLASLGNSNNDMIGMLLADGKLTITSRNTHFSSISISSTLLPNTEYYTKIDINSDIVTVSISQDGINYTSNSTSITNTFTSTLPLFIGIEGDTSTNPFTGSIDLKQFSITVDGVEVFSGNKTGIDTIKPDDYTVVGSPTITDDGIASGFSTRNYIYTGYEINTSNFEIRCKVKFNTQSIVNNVITDGSNNTFLLTRRNNGVLGLSYLASSDNSWKQINTSIAIDNDKWNYCIVGAKNGKIYFYHSYTSFEDVTLIGEQANTISGTYNKTVWISTNYDHSRYIEGSIDLNSFKIYADGNLVYQPCLKIPYTQSKTGSKIVNAIYRDRVNDMAEQFGYANYYTLDENNGNFTLPQGELYGLMGQRVLRASGRTGARYWELYSDRTLEQGGHCENGVVYTFDRPFANDTDFIITIPYSAKTATSFTPSQTGDFIAKGLGNL